ncbi:hypothetical protein ACET3Z_026324 [Daucus carota]
MGEAIVAELAGGLLGKIVSLAAEEVVQAWNFHEDLDTLHQRMESVGALLYDAHTKNLIMCTAKNWFDKLEAVANVANVFMDELAYEVTRRKAENRHKSLDFFIPTKNTLLYRLKVAHKIKSIQASFDEIFKSAVDLGLQPVAYLRSTVQDREIRSTPSYEDKSIIVGRDEDVSYLVQTVCKKHEEDLEVIVVAGMGGQGKTTLARLVFNSDNVITMFPDQRMWITVSDDFDFIKILNQMVESLTLTNLGLTNPQALTRKLQESLKGKKFLLILDDVWNEESVKWDNLRNSLLQIGGDKGSCILVTTRKQEVIDAMRSCVSYWLEKLTEDESYELFKKIAFSDGGVLETEAFATFGRSMHSVSVKAGKELSHDCKDVYVRLDNGVSNIKPTILKRAFERVQVLYAGEDILLHVLPYLAHLTVLVLNADENQVALELPFSLRKMKYLKHLDISHYKLPTDITELYNLQTLRVGDLDELPKRFSNLINLRHLYIRRNYGKKCMFNGIERLTCLQTLPYFVVSKNQNCLVGQLGGLKHLRGEVRLYGLYEVANIEEAKKAKLCEKFSIQCLQLNWRNTEFGHEDMAYSNEDGSNEDEMEDKEYNDQDVMEGLEPHPNLKTLMIVGFRGKKFASWIPMMLNLVKLTLRNCNRCEVLPPLSHLPKLREIVIEGMRNLRVVGDDFCGGQSVFPQLERLNIENCPRLRKILPSCTGVSSQSEFPKLEILKITNCPRLRKIPKSCFPSLKNLVITDLESDMMLGTMSRYVSSLTSLSLTRIGDGGGDSSLSSFSNLESLINNSLSLTELELYDCKGLKCLTLGVSLAYLSIDDCPHLTSINLVEGSAGLKIFGIGILPTSLLDGGLSQIQSSRLDCLRLGPFSEEFDYIPWPFSSSSFSNLSMLNLYGWENVKSLVHFEQRLFTAFPALGSLTLCGFEGLKALPDSIAKLPSLKVLFIFECNNLESLPVFEESHILQALAIIECPVLRQRCCKGQGPEWFKIQYVPNIYCEYKRKMGEAIVADLAGGLLGKLVSLAAEEVVQAWNFHEDLDTLHQRMESVAELLHDAHDKKLIMSTAKNWFDKLEAVANVANVFMDELAYEVTRRKAENRHKALGFFVPSKNTLLYRLKVARQIKSIQASFDEIFKSAVNLGLQPVAYLGSTVQDRDIRSTPSYEDMSIIVGRDQDVSYLVQTVCKKHEEDLQVVVVAGMGGQGKTTLARMVFNSNDTIHNFSKRIWITVSDDFDYIKILNEMIESLTSKNLGLTNPQGLTNKLQKSLKGKRFILILDDVWNEESVKWDNLRNSLLEIGGDKGSCILVTTRKHEVIDAMRSCAGEELSHDCKAVYMRLDIGVSNIKPTILKIAFERVQILYARADIILHVLPYLTHLTVLVLHADYQVAHQLPFSLRKMKYLKHLDISHYRLPSDITERYNLQTLRVGELYRFPKRFSNLINLRHLYINQQGGTKYVFNGIERLTSLQTLPHFVVSKDQNCLVGQLGGLKNLRGKVRLYGLHEVADIEEARKAKLCEKSSIQCLRLNWRNSEFNFGDAQYIYDDGSNEYNDRDVMEGLEPHSNLKTLTIVGFRGKKIIGDGGGDSSSLSSFSNMESMINNSLSLTELELIDCKGLKCLTLGSSLECLVIGDVPHLTSINLVEGSAGLKSITIWKLLPSLLDGVFAEIQSSRLEYLGLGPFSDELDYIPWPFSSSSTNLIELDLFGWEKVKSLALFEQPLFTTYPALTTLNLHYFEGVKALPDSIAKLPSLRDLSILDCKNLESLPTFEKSHILQTLNIVRCPVLRQRCSKGRGPEWFKIQYVPKEKALPSSKADLLSLKQLVIWNSENLESLRKFENNGNLAILKE